MRAALEEAKKAAARNEVPVGAVITDPKTGEIVARAGNRSIEMNDSSAHAEMLAIRQLCESLGQQRIPGYDLYVTLEPCTMCAGAISFARLRRVIFAAHDEKGGAVESGVKFFEQPTCHHRPEILRGPMGLESGSLLKGFFKDKRK